ncbi:hypothetical protein QBC44DRAFT_18559 [Cladorrhinum sp. PSN332]|nr:hypothetical protein QBC44DRAFT_18559 [Cladorrhinum sp. PSN332]
MRHTTLAAIAAAAITNVVANPTPADLSGHHQIPGISARAVADENQEWMGFTCAEYKAWGQVNRTASESWEEFKTNQAWSYAIDKWRAVRDSGTPNPGFREFVLNETLHAADERYCAVANIDWIRDSVCERWNRECNDERGIKPAVGLLIKSLRNLRDIYYDIHWITTPGLPSKSFIDDFIPARNTTPISLKPMAEAFLRTSAGAVEALYMKKAIDESPWAFSNDTATRANIETALVATRNFSASAAARHLKEGSPDDITIRTFNITYKETTEVFLEAIQVHWEGGITDNVFSYMWKGDEDSIAYLTTVIDGGVLWNLTDFHRSDSNFHEVREKMYYAFYIPYLWKMQGHHPVLVSTGWDCTPDGDLHGSAMINAGENRIAEVCVDNKAYYLQDPSGKKPGKLSILPGTQSIGRVSTNIDGTGEYQRTGTEIPVQLDALVEGIIARHSKVGNRFLGSLPEAEEDKAAWQSLWGEILMGGGDGLLPSIVNIPMCDEATVKMNWERVSKGDKLNTALYPCNEEGEQSSGSVRGVAAASWFYAMAIGVVGLVSFC